MPETTYLDASELMINMGPQHPATHGVLRVKLKLDGERVLGSECVIGYLHRGVEKIAENRTYAQFAPYTDRMDYVAAVTNGMGYVEAVEKLLGVEDPAARPVHADGPGRIAAACQPLAVAGNACARPGRHDPGFLHLPGARGNSQDL